MMTSTWVNVSFNGVKGGAQIGVYTNARQFPVVHRAVQPPIGSELMRIVSPEVLITADHVKLPS